ncbi:MAG: hypothetical protein RLN60_03470 [Phycisphaerales bacterium]
MSGESIVDKYLPKQPRRSGNDRDDGNAPASEIRETFRDGEMYVAMLDLVLKGGNRVAMPYSTLLKAEFDPSSGITLRYSTDDVTIQGSRLDQLYKAILQHRAREVVVSGGRIVPAGDGGPVVTAITVTPVS